LARKIEMVLTRLSIKESDQAALDLKYWLSKTPQERLAVVTFLINQNLAPGQRMDRTKFSKGSLK
jgi:hypothetical protein